MMRETTLELAWIIPAALFTVGNGLLAYALLPASVNFGSGLQVLPFWLIMTFGLLGVRLVWKVFEMMFAGIKNPVRELAIWIRSNNWLVAKLVVLMVLAWANMMAFLYIKPVLNIFVPFGADPLLADIDKALFFGVDPWVLLCWMNIEFANKFYHPGWFALMIIALMFLFAAPSSPEKTAMALSYFLLWSIVGPLVHTFFPAGGPIFFERLGYGDRFAGLDPGEQTLRAADYLWYNFYNGEFSPAAGISAMPSMHVTMSAWTVLCFYYFARRWWIPVAAISLYIAILSVALGWHYAVDGIAGIALAFAVYLGLRALFTRLLRGNNSP
ncbi:phosphatase PAP2 family protein [Altererythrobacter sp. MF3-039]|uniref:phosphatase PAP2 family protein n=1 Tax=Altererythrobacter sp. MF3-039 TaxID=3252901 RepID=UPI00390C5F3F